MKHLEKRPHLRQFLPLCVTALLLCMPHQAALAAVTALLDSGAILKQIQAPSMRLDSPKDSGLFLDQDIIGIPLRTKPFAVKRIDITGNKEVDSAALHALVVDSEGKNLTLAQLNQLAVRITDYYRRKGQPLVRAIVPPQVMRAGVVQITVIVARYGRVTLNNRTEVRGALLQSTLAPVNRGQDITQAELDRALLLLSDVPGIAITATLKPGESVGTSDLLVNATDMPRVYGNVVLDNFGNRYTGHERVGVNLSLLNPLKLNTGDALTLNLLTSVEQMRYGRLAYESLLNGQGTRIGGAYSALHYRLGGDVAPLQANGSAQVASLWVRQPMMRSRDINLYGTLQHDRLQLRDHIDVSDTKTDRHMANWTLSVLGDARDGLLSGGNNNWGLSWTQGRLGFDDAAAQSANTASVNTQGSFTKWTASLSRAQRLSTDTSLYLSVSGQRASTNLDSSQKMSLGGPYAVRAYDSGAASGDNAQLTSAEIRQTLSQPWGGQLTGIAFIDSARVTLNKNLWPGASAQNNAALTGAGLGLHWTGPQQWMARAFMAAPVGTSTTAIGSRRATRGWLETRKAF